MQHALSLPRLVVKQLAQALAAACRASLAGESLADKWAGGLDLYDLTYPWLATSSLNGAQAFVRGFCPFSGSLGTEPGTGNRTVLEPEPVEPA